MKVRILANKEMMVNKLFSSLTKRTKFASKLTVLLVLSNSSNDTLLNTSPMIDSTAASLAFWSGGSTYMLITMSFKVKTSTVSAGPGLWRDLEVMYVDLPTF